MSESDDLNQDVKDVIEVAMNGEIQNICHQEKPEQGHVVDPEKGLDEFTTVFNLEWDKLAKYDLMFDDVQTLADINRKHPSESFLMVMSEGGLSGVFYKYEGGRWIVWGTNQGYA